LMSRFCSSLDDYPLKYKGPNLMNWRGS